MEREVERTEEKGGGRRGRDGKSAEGGRKKGRGMEERKEGKGKNYLNSLEVLGTLKIELLKAVFSQRLKRISKLVCSENENDFVLFCSCSKYYFICLNFVDIAGGGGALYFIKSRLWFIFGHMRKGGM